VVCNGRGVRLFSSGGWVLGSLLIFAGGCRADRAGAGRGPARRAPAVMSAPLPAQAAPLSCQPETASPIPVETGRTVHCAIDVGSRNVKLVIASLVEDRIASLQNERQCRVRLQLADRTYDVRSGIARALSRSDQTALVELVQAYRKQCEADGGRMHGAVATEWARRTTNGAEIKRTLEEESGVRMDILDRATEVRYGYLSATRGARGKLVLDFGSRSLQFSFWPRGLDAPEGVSIPLGIDEAGDRYFAMPSVRSYAEGRRALEPVLRAALAPMLKRARADLKRKNLVPELFSLGENGDLALAVSGKLWSGTPLKPVGEAAYGDAVKAHVRAPDPRQGRVTAVLTTADLLGLERVLDQSPTLFEALRAPSLRRVFGNKMLVFPVIVRLLEQELGIATIVLVPQEMADGLLIDRLSGHGVSAGAP
jgi:hypothetical protein